MWWQTAELRQRYKSTVFIWVGLVIVASLWTLCCDSLADVGAIFNSPWVVRAHEQLRWFSALSMYPFYVLFAGLLFWGWRRQNPPLRVISWGYLIAQLIASLVLVRIIKALVGHARPDFNPLSRDIAESWIGPTLDASFQGFPSGHTTDLFISAIFLSMLLPKVWMRISIMAFAAICGFVRITLAKHYPVDVLGGVLLGGLTALLVLRCWVLPRLQLLGTGSPEAPAAAKASPH